MRLAHVLRAYEAQLKSRHFQPGDDTFFYSILLKLSLQPSHVSWRRRLQQEVKWNAQHCESAGQVTAKHKVHRRHSDCSHCHHAASSKEAPPCVHHRNERAKHHSCSKADAAQNTKRLALAALWTWRCHSAFDCRRGPGYAGPTAKADDGRGVHGGQCRRRVPCSVCAHASARLLRRSTEHWRRTCTACQHTRQLDKQWHCTVFQSAHSSSTCIQTRCPCEQCNNNGALPAALPFTHREQQELQGRQEAAANSFRATLLSRRALFAWRQAHTQLQQLQVCSFAAADILLLVSCKFAPCNIIHHFGHTSANRLAWQDARFTCRVSSLQAKALQLWTAGSQRASFAAWRTLLRDRRAVIGRLAASAAANTRRSSLRVLLTDWAALDVLSCCG